MGRKYNDWLTGFLEYTSFGEAPPKMYFWVGLTTLAAALRRRVWIDQGHFQWYPNLYVVLVAPPGIVSKSTTANIGINLLRKVPGIQFGPDVTTWQALFDAFRDVHVGVPYNGQIYEMSCLTIAASEFGNFLRPDDSWMVDQLVNLWDGQPVKKRARMTGEEIINNPCLNLIGCTTPSWIAGNVPEYLIGGGLTSRMIFVYAEKKIRFVAYPEDSLPPNFAEQQKDLIADLTHISTLFGKFTMHPAAKEWGREWYEHFHSVEAKNIDETLLGGYIARKQTLAHKVAMLLTVSQTDDLTITRPTLERSVKLLTELEKEMPKIYSKIGMTSDSKTSNDILAFIKRAGGSVSGVALYRYVHKLLPNPQKFNEIIEGLLDAHYITVTKDGGDFIVRLSGDQHE